MNATAIVQSSLLSFSLLFLAACNSSSAITEGEPECPDIPPTLSVSDVKAISLTENTRKESGQARDDRSVGYRFEGETGQKLSYQTADEVCVWVYDRKNEPITGSTLPETGTYVLQVAALEGSTTYNLEMSLVVPRPVYNFSRGNYPQAECGDPLPTDPAAFPVNFYPVNVAYSSSNLQKAKSLFCRDAYQKTHKTTGQKMIQISSFTDRDKAIAFANFVGSEIRGVHVGEPTTVNSR